MKTSELKGPALDWAVAKCEGLVQGVSWEHWAPRHSTNWAQGGPIIEREHINVSYEGQGVWLAGGFNGVCYLMGHGGPTPLIAAMRCYVAIKLGDEVEIPEELK